MKRILQSLVILAILLALVPSYAFDESLITAPATASGIAYTGKGWFNGFALKTDGTNNVTVNIYDGLAVTATLLIPTSMVVPGTDYYFGYKPPSPIRVTTGIYVTVAVAGGGTCSYQVFYSRVRR